MKFKDGIRWDIINSAILWMDYTRKDIETNGRFADERNILEFAIKDLLFEWLEEPLTSDLIELELE